MIAAKYNLWWYLSFIVPAVLMLIGTFWHKKHLLIAAIILSLSSTYTLSSISVREKWKSRFELAQTQEEPKYASTDGANLVFTAFVIGPLEAIFYTAFWGFLGWKLWPKHKNKKEKTT